MPRNRGIYAYLLGLFIRQEHGVAPCPATILFRLGKRTPSHLIPPVFELRLYLFRSTGHNEVRFAIAPEDKDAVENKLGRIFGAYDNAVFFRDRQRCVRRSSGGIGAIGKTEKRLGCFRKLRDIKNVQIKIVQAPVNRTNGKHLVLLQAVDATKNVVRLVVGSLLTVADKNNRSRLPGTNRHGVALTPVPHITIGPRNDLKIRKMLLISFKPLLVNGNFAPASHTDPMNQIGKNNLAPSAPGDICRKAHVLKYRVCLNEPKVHAELQIIAHKLKPLRFCRFRVGGVVMMHEIVDLFFNADKVRRTQKRSHILFHSVTPFLMRMADRASSDHWWLQYRQTGKDRLASE